MNTECCRFWSSSETIPKARQTRTDESGVPRQRPARRRSHPRRRRPLHRAPETSYFRRPQLFPGSDARRRIRWRHRRSKLARSPPRCSRPASRPMGSFISARAIAPAQRCMSRACRRPLRARSCSISKFRWTELLRAALARLGLRGCRFGLVGLAGFGFAVAAWAWQMSASLPQEADLHA